MSFDLRASRLPPPKEISTAACVHGGVGGRPPGRPVRATPDHFCGVGCPIPLSPVISPIARRAGWVCRTR